jgi:hypothetical protein
VGVAFLLLSGIIFMGALLAIVLGWGCHHKPGGLLTTTALLAAMRPGGPLANAINGACPLVAFLSVGAIVAPLALLTTIQGRAGDVEGLLLDAISA